MIPFRQEKKLFLSYTLKEKSKNNLKKKSLQTLCINSLEDLKAHNINVISVEKISSLANSMIFATATSARHAKALSEKLVENVKNSGEIVLGVEGNDDCEWILIDCEDVIVNIMIEKIRKYYDLESLWSFDGNLTEIHS